jgi:hypothetical protein
MTIIHEEPIGVRCTECTEMLVVTQREDKKWCVRCPNSGLPLEEYDGVRSKKAAMASYKKR